MADEEDYFFWSLEGGEDSFGINHSWLELAVLWSRLEDEENFFSCSVLQLEVVEILLTLNLQSLLIQSLIRFNNFDSCLWEFLSQLLLGSLASIEDDNVFVALIHIETLWEGLLHLFYSQS